MVGAAHAVLVDSSVWIDHFNGTATAQVAWLRDALDEGVVEVLTGDLIVQEVLQGFRLDSHFKQADAALGIFTCFTLGGRERCVEAARLYRRLRKSGVTIRKPVDVLIAAFCMRSGFALLHADRDFDVIAANHGLEIIAV